MKKLTLTVISLVLASCVFALSGCEMSINLNKKPDVTASLDGKNPNVPETMIVEITDEDGSVLGTDSVTLTGEQAQIRDDFFKPSGPNKPTKGPSGNRVESGNDKKAQDDAAILNSDQYMIVVRIVDNGEDVIYKIARKGKKNAMMFDYDGQEMGMIIDSKNVYLLSIEEKSYVKVPKTMLMENSKDPELNKLLTGNPLEFDRTVVSRTKKTEKGVKYNVVEYKNGIKDYFVGKTIIKSVATDGSEMYYDSVSPVAPDTLFIPPKGFNKTELTDSAVDNLAGKKDHAEKTTDTNHKHNKK